MDEPTNFRGPDWWWMGAFILALVVLIGLFGNWYHAVDQGGKTRRERIEACSTIEDHAALTLCLNHD